MPIYVIWFVIALIFAIAELASSTFYSIFLAGGAFVAGVVAFLWPDLAIWVQAVLAVAVAIAGVAIVRPVLARRLRSRGARVSGPGVHGGFVGHSALTLDVVGDQLHPGHVRLAGETWLAYNDSAQPIDAGASVIVRAVRGTTLLVQPAGSPSADSPEG